MSPLNLIYFVSMICSMTNCSVQRSFYVIGTESDLKKRLFIVCEGNQRITYLVSFVCLGKALFKHIHTRTINKNYSDNQATFDQSLLELIHINQSIALNSTHSFTLIDYRSKPTRDILAMLEQKELISLIQQHPDVYTTKFCLNEH